MEIGTDKDLVMLQRWYREGELRAKEDVREVLRRRLIPVLGNGSSVSTEEKLIRLMVWVGTALLPGPRDTRLSDVFEIFTSGEAQCRQQSFVFARVASAYLGVAARPLGLYHTDGKNGHVIAEVNYSNGWHLFDPSTLHLSIYRHPLAGYVMSYDEICKNLDVVRAEENWFRGENGTGKEGFFRLPRKEFTYVHFELPPWTPLERKP